MLGSPVALGLGEKTLRVHLGLEAGKERLTGRRRVGYRVDLGVE